jgi:hypothetical protein
MLQVKQKPYNLLLLTAIFSFIAGLSQMNVLIDIHLHDTFFVLPLAYFIWSFSLILIILWLLYRATEKILFSKKLSFVHIISTIVCCLFILILPYFINPYKGLAGMPRIYSENGRTKTYNLLGDISNSAISLLSILVFAQLFFLLNFFIGLYRRANNRRVEKSMQ